MRFLQGNIARAFFQDGFFMPAKQSNILCYLFRSPKSLHFSVERISNNKFFLSRCFFPRLCKCGTIFLNVLEKLVCFTAPCISLGNCYKNNWYRSFNTWLWLCFGLPILSWLLFFYFCKNIITTYLAKPHDSGPIIDKMYCTSSGKKYKIIYWRSL